MMVDDLAALLVEEEQRQRSNSNGVVVGRAQLGSLKQEDQHSSLS
jgi:hypothetical protein